MYKIKIAMGEYNFVNNEIEILIESADVCRIFKLFDY